MQKINRAEELKGHLTSYMESFAGKFSKEVVEKAAELSVMLEDEAKKFEPPIDLSEAHREWHKITNGDYITDPVMAKADWFDKYGHDLCMMAAAESAQTVDGGLEIRQITPEQLAELLGGSARG